MPRLISYSKHLSAATRAFCASSTDTARHIVCTEDAWVMRMILIFSRLRASKSLLLNPGTPTMPLPSSESRAMSSLLEMPMMSSRTRGACLSMRVPGNSGLNVLLT